MLTGWDMGISTHWGGRWQRWYYMRLGCISPAADSSYHGLVSGGRAENGNTTLVKMVGASHSRYPRDKSGVCSRGGGGGDGGRGIRVRERLVYGRTEVEIIK